MYIHLRMVFVLPGAAEKFEHLVAIANRDVNIFQMYKMNNLRNRRAHLIIIK